MKSRRMKNLITVGYDRHNPLLPKFRQKLGKTILFNIVSNLPKSQFHHESTIVPLRTQLIHHLTQSLVNRNPPLQFRAKSLPIVYMAYLEDDFLEFGGGGRRKEGLVSGTWRSLRQFQHLDLAKVGDRRYNSSLNGGWSGKDVGLMKIAGEGYLHGSPAVSLRIFAVVALN